MTNPAVPAPPPQSATTPSGRMLNEDEQALRAAFVALRSEISKAVVGQDSAVTGLIISLIAGGHTLLEGVPGVAKTLLVRTLATALDLKMTRIQFTPDLMPADVTGSLVWDSGKSAFEFRRGPVFTNLLLADEINRTPPKTQSSLLEAMEEHQVSVDGQSHRLDDPFMVIATQNPVEYEGTYPLPEAQLDRFLMKITLDLPPRDAEIAVVSKHQHGFNPLALTQAGITAVAGPEEIRAAREHAQRIDVQPAIIEYIVDLVRATRNSPSVRLGVSPRGATALLQASKVWAFLQGRGFVTPDDVKGVAVPVLAHRIGMKAEADLEGLTAQAIVEGILSQVPVPR